MGDISHMSESALGRRESGAWTSHRHVCSELFLSSPCNAMIGQESRSLCFVLPHGAIAFHWRNTLQITDGMSGALTSSLLPAVRRFHEHYFRNSMMM